MIKKVIFLLSSCILLFSCLTVEQKDLDKANDMRKKIDKYKLKKYAEQEVNEADKKFDESKELMDKKKNAPAKKAIDSANELYTQALDKAFPLCTDDKKKETDSEKTKAESIKANIAVKEQFNEASEVYNDGVSAKDTKNYEGSIDNLVIAKDKYNKVYAVAKEKKERTEKSINQTEEWKAEVEKNNGELKKRIEEIKKGIETDDNSSDVEVIKWKRY